MIASLHITPLLLIALHAGAVYAADSPQQRSVESLVLDLEEKGGARTQSESIDALTKIGKPAVIPLIGQLNHREYATIGRVAIALNVILKNPANQTTEARDRLIRLAQDERFHTASEALGLLRHFNDSPAIDAMKNAVLHHKDENVRASGVEALATSQQWESHRKFFQSLLTEKTLNVVAPAAFALIRMGDSRGVDAARRGIREPSDTYSLRSAAEALSINGDPADIPLLQNTLAGKRDPEVFRAIQILKYKNLHSTDEKRMFLENALTEMRGRIFMWAALELANNSETDPFSLKSLEDAASNPKHPHWDVARTYLNVAIERQKKR